MKIGLVNAKSVAPAVGPYSHAVTLDDLVFISGNVGIDSEARLVSADVVEQTIQAFRNIRIVLEASGSIFGRYGRLCRCKCRLCNRNGRTCPSSVLRGSRSLAIGCQSRDRGNRTQVSLTVTRSDGR